jgi:hypothetical protein
MSAAFVTLFLAHLIADYPLQTDWLVKAKRTWSGLIIHVAIHLMVLLLVCLPHLSTTWPFLVVLAIAHLLIDAFKSALTRWRPQWNAGGYLFDQLLHILSIWAIGKWAMLAIAGGWPIQRTWQIYLIAFLLVTSVWYITESVLFSASQAYQRELFEQRWTRMATRAIFLVVLLSLRPPRVTPGVAAGILTPLPYWSGSFGRRALLTDLCVTSVVAALSWFVA